MNFVTLHLHSTLLPRPFFPVLVLRPSLVREFVLECLEHKPGSEDYMDILTEASSYSPLSKSEVLSEMQERVNADLNSSIKNPIDLGYSQRVEEATVLAQQQFAERMVIANTEKWETARFLLLNRGDWAEYQQDGGLLRRPPEVTPKGETATNAQIVQEEVERVVRLPAHPGLGEENIQRAKEMEAAKKEAHESGRTRQVADMEKKLDEFMEMEERERREEREAGKEGEGEGKGK